MERHVGEEFDGVVTGVASFGLFVDLPELRVTGMLHVTQLPNDYYHFDAKRHRLSGERTRRVFQLADRVRVKVLRVDPVERRIDFRLAGAAETRAEQRERLDRERGRPQRQRSGGQRR
jgi:ribonuclease R